MESMRRLDEFILDHLYQPVADVLTELLDTTNIRLAIGCIFCYIGAVFVSTGNRVEVATSLHFANGLVTFGLLNLARMLLSQERRMERYPINVNILRMEYENIRPLFLIFSAMVFFSHFKEDLSGIVLGAEITRDIMLVSIFYFASCERRPPGLLKPGNSFA